VGILISKRLTARRLYKSFGVKGLRWTLHCVRIEHDVINAADISKPDLALKHHCLTHAFKHVALSIKRMGMSEFVEVREIHLVVCV
jgi:hypothetical protein